MTDQDLSIQPQFRRILTIDGGGLLGTLPAAFLAELEDTLPYPIGDYFDLIVGTSTGGILAIGLGMGYTAADLLKFYEDEGPIIFAQQETEGIKARLRWFARKAKQLWKPKYDAEVLRAALQKKLGNRQLGESHTRLAIPAWNPTLRTVHVYKTAHHPRFTRDYKVLALDAAMATSAASTYFKQHTTEQDLGLIDGGSWANNPIAIAIIEAIAVLGWPTDALRVLSLGCLDETYALPANLGIGKLGSKAFNLLMDGQSSGAMGMARLLTGDPHEREAIFRINHEVPWNTFRLDDVSIIKTLKGIGYAKARDSYPKLTPLFFNHPSACFTPCHQLNEVTT